MSPGDPLLEARELRARFDEEPSHSDHVAALALQLFDGLQPWHKLECRERDLLHTAALLHDIGWSQTPDGKGHHKASAKLIRNHSWRSLEPAEVELVAQVARYHRKAPPAPDHEDFQKLKPAARKRVMALGGILRIADALDRTHTSRICAVEVKVGPKALLVIVRCQSPWDEERDMFALKSDMLASAAGRPVHVESAPASE